MPGGIGQDLERQTAPRTAPAAKYQLICRKLGLDPGMWLLDVGCGWGGMVMHAARHHGVRAVGVTVSRRQAELAERALRAQLLLLGAQPRSRP